MSCEFILRRGKNKGKQCSLKGKLTLNTKMYCTRHYKKAEENMAFNERNAMKKEDFNCNEDKLAVDTFIIIREIGKGSFGRVMMIKTTDTQEQYAMKITNNKVKKEADLLYFEYTLLSHHFVDNNHFPRLLSKVSNSYKRTEKETYLVLEYFEETLQQRFLRCNEQFSEQHIKSYGLQILNIIEYIHSKHYLYIDIKPENFMFKSKDDDTIKIIDFGLCQKYVDYKGQHIQSKKLSNPIGTDLYSSIRMMSRIQCGRIDDIECIGYLLLYLSNSDLPWSKASSPEEVLSMKKDIHSIDASNAFFNAPHYIKSFITSSRLHKSFEVKPDYAEFKAFLSS